MIAPGPESTIGEAFRQCVTAFGPLPFLAAPANPARAYHPQGFELGYAEAGVAVEALVARYAAAGYGLGHRIALLMENRPEHLLHKLAINSLGICCVPLNADHRAREMAYVIDHAKVDLVIAVDTLRPLLDGALREATHRPEVAAAEAGASPLPPAARAAAGGAPAPDTAASVLYTSGTTGRPKGCVLSHHYELEAGRWYASAGALASFRDGEERLYNPLPLFHVNASIFSFFCVMLRGNCQVQADRFSPGRWWAEVHQSRATVVHYLGVVVPMLLAQPPSDLDRGHRLRFAIGAGVDPQRHAEFEQRFGFPLIEIWGMTEMVRAIFDNEPPRQVGTRVFGRPRPGLEVRIVDDQDRDLPEGSPGEMLVRHSNATPRASDGLLRFVDRRKNIIRRSGENIAAAEVEAVLQAHPLVEQAAVLAVPDELREEEVLACVVLAPAGRADAAAAVESLFEHCLRELAYYKAPGWIRKRRRLLPAEGARLRRMGRGR